YCGKKLMEQKMTGDAAGGPNGRPLLDPSEDGIVVQVKLRTTRPGGASIAVKGPVVLRLSPTLTVGGLREVLAGRLGGAVRAAAAEDTGGNGDDDDDEDPYGIGPMDESTNNGADPASALADAVDAGGDGGDESDPSPSTAASAAAEGDTPLRHAEALRPVHGGAVPVRRGVRRPLPPPRRRLGPRGPVPLPRHGRGERRPRGRPGEAAGLPPRADRLGGDGAVARPARGLARRVPDRARRQLGRAVAVGRADEGAGADRVGREERRRPQQGDAHGLHPQVLRAGAARRQRDVVLQQVQGSRPRLEGAARLQDAAHTHHTPQAVPLLGHHPPAGQDRHPRALPAGRARPPRPREPLRGERDRAGVRLLRGVEPLRRPGRGALHGVLQGGRRDVEQLRRRAGHAGRNRFRGRRGGGEGGRGLGSRGGGGHPPVGMDVDQDDSDAREEGGGDGDLPALDPADDLDDVM
ncbi:hypothetical protein THAOC_28680, partial [Thalassiosira oceanica]